jgi:hypothetical protein
MKPIRYVVGVIGFLFVGFVVAVVVGFIVTFFVPPKEGRIVGLGIGMDWRNLPGTILGCLQAYSHFERLLENRRRRMINERPVA